MVLRKSKKNRKYLGTRRWGVGNIKNARGKGDKGGTGEVNRLRKHDWTYITAKAPWLIRKKGFTPWRKKILDEITLTRINEMSKSGAKLEFAGYKVLSNGNIEKGLTITATAFSQPAIEKIKAAGGQAVLLKQKDAPAPKPQTAAEEAKN